MKLTELVQQRLSLFVYDETGTPRRKVPLYAEVVLAESPREGTFDCPELRAFAEKSPEQAKAIAEAVVALVPLEWANEWCGRLMILIRNRLEEAGYPPEAEVDDGFTEAARAAVAEGARDLEAPSLPEVGTFPHTRYPLGLVATDHSGYASYDLSRLELSKAWPQWAHALEVDIVVHPVLLEQWEVHVLTQHRVAPDAVVGKLELPLSQDALLDHLALNLPAMQNPGLIDWRLSPGSFAAVPQTLIGADGCESLTPATFATSRFHMRQVVRLPRTTVRGTTHAAADVIEYAVSLIPIGHSLGQVMYSLPLAPGESVRLAVIDWRRSDSAVRSESVQVTEDLLHQQSHDRTISETVNAAIDEWQRGGSLMGGLAGGGGLAMGPFAGGAMASLGGGYATSSGSRDVAIDTTQQISDSVHQASSSVREQHATVVVQTDQHERQDIETRAIVNYNRGHTLTVLYYEVLRHFRVVTEATRRYRAVLMPRVLAWDLSNDTLLLDKRRVLSAALLDPELSDAFDALARRDAIRSEQSRNPATAATPDDEGAIEFTRFRFHCYVGNETSKDPVSFSVRLQNQAIRPLHYGGHTNFNKATQFNFTESTFVLDSDPAAPIAWRDLHDFIFRKTSGGDPLRVVNLEVSGIGPQGERKIYHHTPGKVYLLGEEGDTHLLPVTPPPPPVPVPAVPTLDQQTSPEDYAQITRLKAHLTREYDHYARVLDLTADRNWYARHLGSQPFGSGMAVDAIAPTPLELFGADVAFPLLDQADLEPLDVPLTETLISLPTRGLFAEAKLGHCSVAEEIDETRFWRWDEHPLPFLASDIEAVQPIRPEPVAQDLTPSPLAPPVASIQAPTSLPDPGGMAAAIKALTTPDIFRDMSMKEEVGQLLSDLIEGSVSMAAAATRAQEIQSGMKTDLDKQQREQAARFIEADASVRRAEVEAHREREQRVTPAEAQHAVKVAESQERKGNVTKAEVKEVAKNQISNIKGSKPATTATFPRRFEVTVQGRGGATIIGQWAWELFHRGESVGFRPLERYDDGRFRITYTPEDDDRRFRFKINGEVLSGYAVNATFHQEQLDLEIPESVWAKDYIYITLAADTETWETTATSAAQAAKNFTDSVSISGGFNKIIAVGVEGGLEWQKTDTTSTGTAMKMNIIYYTGGIRVARIF